MSNYAYPLDPGWSKEDIIKVVTFLSQVEAAYEGGVSLGDLMLTYREFKTVVDSIAGEKRMDREFKQITGYSIYQVIKQAKSLRKDQQSDKTIVRM